MCRLQALLAPPAPLEEELLAPPAPLLLEALVDPQEGEVVKVTLVPRYGVCPVLVIVVVSFTTVPGVAVAGLNAEAMASWVTVTVAVQRGPGLAAGQLLSADGELIVLARIPFPVSGLFTVTV